MPGVRCGTCTEGCARARRTYLAGIIAIVAVLGAGCSGAPKPKAHAVAIQGFEFVPATISVAVGDTMVWTNNDLVPHTATAADKAWDTGSIAPGESRRVVIEGAGEHPYLCSFHPTMKGNVVAR